MMNNPYATLNFLKSAHNLSQLPPDEGIEVAFVGRSNAGKSSALNCLTGIKNLARTSKTPGRTQLINLFTLDETKRLVDLPGYGYAKVSFKIKDAWQKNLALYLEQRQCLKGLVLVMDSRHPLKDLDTSMLDWALRRGLFLHLLLTKVDKISRSELKSTLLSIKKYYESAEDLLSLQGFSAVKKQGVEELIQCLNLWFEI